MPSPTVHTLRLTLRPPQLTDAKAIFDAYAQDAEVTRYVIWSPHKSVAETEEWLRGSVLASESGARHPFIIESRADGRLIGMIELRPNGCKADFGYVLARAEWGKGYMTESLQALIEFAFTLPGVRRVWAVCDVDNVASARVMEKAGLQLEGVLRKFGVHPNISSEPRDVFCYSIVR
jgi:RimJ/RimL family protein N-acetyltransferase